MGPVDSIFFPRKSADGYVPNGIIIKGLWHQLPTCCFRVEIGRPRTRKKNCEQGERFERFCRVKRARESRNRGFHTQHYVGTD